RSSAGLTFRFLMRAAAWGLRTTQAWCMPGIWMSSRYTAVPVMRRGSSRRRIFFPTRVSGFVVVVAMLYPRLRRGRFHRIDDVLITRATADIAFETLADLLVGRVGIVGQQLL